MLELAEIARSYCSGTTLTVSDDLNKHEGVVWQRTWSPYHSAAIWPEGNYGTVLLPLPRGKESQRLCMHAAASVLNKNGKVIVYGLNDYGIRTTGKLAEEVFIDIECVYTGSHGRIWRLQSPRRAIKTSIEDFATGAPPWRSYAGLFAGGSLDDATQLMIENLPPVPAGAAVMDFACGIGVIAHAVRHTTVTLVDNDPLALHAAAQNVPGATTQLCGDPSQLQGKYNFIFSNPPIHDGNEKSFCILGAFINRLPHILAAGGAAYCVAQVTVPVARIAKESGLSAEETAANRSFRVTCIKA